MSNLDQLERARSEITWDAVVIGGGPGGAIAARQLALAGKRTLLVEKHRMPRDKVCGGCLGGAALDVLAAVGLADLPAECGGVSLDTFLLGGHGAVATAPIGRRIAISRRTFDAALVREAVDAGAVVCQGVKATLLPAGSGGFRQVALRCAATANELVVHTQVVVLATGLGGHPPEFTSRVAPRARVGLGAICDSPPCDLPSRALLMACGARGYVGVTELEHGRFAVAAAVDPRSLAAARRPGGLVEELLRHADFEPAVDLQDLCWRGTPPLSHRAKPLASHRCLLVGDAAGYVEPFTGEGIGWALQSGVLAAALLTRPLESWDAQIENQWRAMYQSSFAGPQRWCRLITAALRSTAVQRLAIYGLRRAPVLSRPIVARLDHSLRGTHLEGSTKPNGSRTALSRGGVAAT